MIADCSCSYLGWQLLSLFRWPSCYRKPLHVATSSGFKCFCRLHCFVSSFPSIVLVFVPARRPLWVRGHRPKWFGCCKWSTHHPRCQSSPQGSGWGYVWSRCQACLCILINYYQIWHYTSLSHSSVLSSYIWLLMGTCIMSFNCPCFGRLSLLYLTIWIRLLF